MSDANFEEKLALGSKNDEFDFKMSSGKSKNLHFDVLILLRAYRVSAKKMEKGYLSWH